MESARDGRRRSLARLSASIVAIGIAVLAVPAAAAAAQTETRTVDGEVVFQYQTNAERPGNCSAIVFVQWEDVPGTVGAVAHYTLTGEPQSEGSTPPFDDVFEWVATYRVPAGHHWIEVARSWIDGPRPVSCEDLSTHHRDIYGHTATVELTVEVPEACTAAQRTADAQERRMTKLQAKLDDASRAKAKRRLRRALGKARTKRAKALERAERAC